MFQCTGVVLTVLKIPDTVASALNKLSRNAPSDLLIVYFTAIKIEYFASLFRLYFTIMHCSTISVLFFSSYHRHRQLTGDRQLLCARMSCAAVCENHIKGVASASRCVSVDMLGHVWWGRAERCGAVRVGPGGCEERVQSERRSPSENYQCSFSHPRPYSDLSFSNPVWHFGHTAVCSWGKKREKWDMKCQLFDCVRHSMLIKQVSARLFSFHCFDELNVVVLCTLLKCQFNKLCCASFEASDPGVLASV